MVNAFHTSVHQFVHPSVRLSGFNINLNISIVYKDIFITFAGNVYGYKEFVLNLSFDPCFKVKWGHHTKMSLLHTYYWYYGFRI